MNHETSSNPALNEEIHVPVHDPDPVSQNLTSEVISGQADRKDGPKKVKKPAVAKPKDCTKSDPAFDPRQLVEISLHLDVLENFATLDPPNLDQYVIRVCVKDETVHHSICQAFVMPARDSNSDNHPTPIPSDIIVDDEICLKYCFKDIIDNPIVLRLLDTSGLPEDGNFNDINPIGSICLDVASLLNYQTGFVDKHIEPWIISDPKILKSFLNGNPLLHVNLECQQGMPTTIQLRQGNILTFFIGSMVNLPDEIFPYISDSDYDPKVDVVLTSPHSGKHPYLHFPRGQYKDSIYVEPPHTFQTTLDEATQTQANNNNNNKDPKIKPIGSTRFAPTRHWASVMENIEGIPLHATAVSSAFPVMEDETEEVFGDAAELYKNSLDTQKYCEAPHIDWNSQHIRYIPVESYKKMLTRLSQDVIWPVEIAVTVKKPLGPLKRVSDEEQAVKTESLKDLRKSRKKSKKNIELEEEETGQESEGPEIFYMNELGGPLPSDRILIYHGIAFVDLSRLIYPGVQKVKFACKVYPYSAGLLGTKTCLVESAFNSILPDALPPSYDFPPPRPTSQDSFFKENGTVREHCQPFIVFEFHLKRAIIPLFKTLKETPDIVHDYIEPRDIPRRRLTCSDTAKKNFRKAVIQAAAEISNEFSNHFWTEVVLGRGDKSNPEEKRRVPPSPSLQALKNGFVFYLNASGRYLVLREHLREAVTQFVQQRCLDFKRDSNDFKTHRDFQSFLTDMYINLIDELHDSLSQTVLQEADPLEPFPKPPKGLCAENSKSNEPLPFKEYEKKSLLRQLLFYSEESFAQGDYENSQRLHLQRICISKEDSFCWVDFGIMWLSKGDNRMAEISMREAIRKNPNNVYALLIGGFISIAHNDERGIDCLIAALALRPSCPELMVILAIAYAQVGNAFASDFFFRRAAYFHCILTGKSLLHLDEKLELLTKTVGIKQSIQNIALVEKDKILDLSPPSSQETEHGEGDKNSSGKKTSNASSHLVPPSAIFSIVDEHSQPNKFPRTATKPKVETSNTQHTEHTGDHHHVHHHRSSLRKSLELPAINPSHSHGNSTGHVHHEKSEVGRKISIHEDHQSSAGKGSSSHGHHSHETPTEEEGEIELSEFEDIPSDQEKLGYPTRKIKTKEKSSYSKERKSLSSGDSKRFNFSKELRKICLADVYLPPLSPSIRIPWNITEFNDKLKDFLDNASSAYASSNLTTPESNNNGTPGMGSKPSTGSGNTNSTTLAADDTIKAEYDKIIHKKETKQSRKSLAEASRKGTRKSLNDLNSIQIHESGDESEAEHYSIGTSDYSSEKSTFSEEIKPHVYDDRLGSELIWTGQLLLHLRMFDMLDGVLTRELYYTGYKTIQFIYLRAMSLYLRQNQAEAILFLDEALALDEENAILWILKGHCYYELGMNLNAAQSYEKALRLPIGKENRHLLYLRYGTLSLEAGNSEIAKKVFLHGVQKYPTPYVWLAVGNTCYNLKEFDQAEAAFSEANRLDNTDPIIWAHLSLINLAQNQRTLAEQSYKWALRFGLKKGKILDEIKKLQAEKGFGDPSFPRVPNCIPHDYYVRRLGRQKPFDMYRDALLNQQPSMGRQRFDDSEREKELKLGITKIAELQGIIPPTQEPAGKRSIDEHTNHQIDVPDFKFDNSISTPETPLTIDPKIVQTNSKKSVIDVSSNKRKSNNSSGNKKSLAPGQIRKSVLPGAIGNRNNVRKSSLKKDPPIN